MPPNTWSYRPFLEGKLTQAPKFAKISRGAGRRWAIADIHGCSLTFEALLQKIDLKPQDQLFLLGDYISRGPKSPEVLHKIINLILNDWQVFPLRGNHEEMILQKHEKRESRRADKLQHELPLGFINRISNLEGFLLPEFVPFFTHLPFYYETDVAFLVHGGFDFTSGNPFQDYDKMLWLRNFIPSPELVGERPVVHGHTPTSLQIIEAKVRARSLDICLDNGCVFYNRPDHGKLLALNLDNYELVAQNNLDYLDVESS